MTYNLCGLLIIIAIFTCNIANCEEEYFQLSANSTTVHIKNISPYGLDIGNLNIARMDGASKIIATTGPILLHRNASCYVYINPDLVGPGNTLILYGNNYEIFGSCIVEDN